MADIKHFVAKTKLTSGSRPQRSSLLQKVHTDSITVKQLSRDGLAALIHKQRQKTISRSALNDAMLQNIKQEQQMAKSLKEKLSSLPELHAARSKTSATASLTNSNTLLRAISPDAITPTYHGYRFRSNGDVRLYRKKSMDEEAEKYDETHQRDLTSLKQTLLKSTMIHSRNEHGDYMFGSMLNQLLTRESRVSKPMPELSDNIDIFRFITKDHRHYRHLHSRTTSDSLFQSDLTLREKPLIGRKYFVKENDRFVNKMMQQIYLLERNSNSLRYFGHQHEPPAFLQENEVPLDRGLPFVQSDPSFMSARQKSLKNVNTTPLTRTRSAFSTRYGVSSTVLESRKPLLDQYMDLEMQNLAKTDEEINEYIRDIQEIVIEKEKKRNRNEAGKDVTFDLWQNESSAILDGLEDDVPTQTEILSDPT